MRCGSGGRRRSRGARGRCRSPSCARSRTISQGSTSPSSGAVSRTSPRGWHAAVHGRSVSIRRRRSSRRHDAASARPASSSPCSRGSARRCRCRTAHSIWCSRSTARRSGPTRTGGFPRRRGLHVPEASWCFCATRRSRSSAAPTRAPSSTGSCGRSSACTGSTGAGTAGASSSISGTATGSSCCGPTASRSST
jgi:hypothetical protein